MNTESENIKPTQSPVLNKKTGKKTAAVMMMLTQFNVESLPRR